MIYIVIILYLLFVAYNMEFKKGIKFNKVSYISEWIILTLLFGLRYRVGGDTLWYEEEFRTLPTLEEYFRYGFDFYPYQPLWYISNGIIKKIWDNFYFFQTIHCAFLNSVFFYVFLKYSKIPFTCVLFYFFFIYPYFGTEIIRESIAVAIFSLSTNYLFKAKYLKYYLFVIIAFLFHASAAFLFVIPPLYLLFVKKKNHQYLLIFLTSFILMISSLVIVQIVESITGLDPVSAGKIMRYNAQAETMNFNGMIMPIASFVFGLMFLRFLKTREYCLPEGFLVLLSFFLVFTFCRVFFDIIMQRFANYMIPFFYLSLSFAFFEYIKNKKKVLMMLLVFFYFFINQIYFYFHSSPMYTFGKDKVSSIYRYYPYYSIFEMKKDETRERMIYCLDANTQYAQPFE